MKKTKDNWIKALKQRPKEGTLTLEQLKEAVKKVQKIKSDGTILVESDKLNKYLLEEFNDKIQSKIEDAIEKTIDEIYDKGVGSSKKEAGIYYPFRSMAYLERLHYEQHKNDK